MMICFHPWEQQPQTFSKGRLHEQKDKFLILVFLRVIFFLFLALRYLLGIIFSTERDTLWAPVLQCFWKPRFFNFLLSWCQRIRTYEVISARKNPHIFLYSKSLILLSSKRIIEGGGGEKKKKKKNLKFFFFFFFFAPPLPPPPLKGPPPQAPSRF